MQVRIATWGACVFVLLAASFLFFWGLGQAPLQDYDESTYAQVTHEMRASGDYLAPTRAGEVYFEKPPLYFWLASASSDLFGESEFALRFPSALLGLATIVTVMLIAYELSLSLGTAALAGAILTTSAPFIETARQVRIDVPVTFFIMLAVYGFLRGLKDDRWYLLFWAAVGGAVMLKSVVAVFSLFGVGTFALWLWEWRFFKSRYFYFGVLLCALIVLPWHLYMFSQFGSAFVGEYIGFDIVTRAAQDIFAVQNSNGSYVWYLVNFDAPWLQVAVLGIVPLLFFWRILPARARAGAAASATAGALILAVFFYSATKAPTYLTPIYPFMAVAIGLALQNVFAERKDVRALFLSTKSFAALFCAVLFVTAFSNTVYNAFHFNPYFAQTDELAREEKLVGSQMRTMPAPLYAFEDTNLGSIMYYSGNTKPLSIGEDPVASGSYIVLPSAELAALEALYPSLNAISLYTGSQISLLQIV